MKRLAVLGSTGSIGEQTLSVVGENPDRFEIVALAAGSNVALLEEQIRRFAPKCVSLADEADARVLRSRVGTEVEVYSGRAGLEQVACSACDLVMAALVGAVGLAPTLAAIRSGHAVALANKEVMVMAGSLVRREAQAHGVEILPVDSEHSAIFQALAGQRREDVERLVLTCSGGPFRQWSRERIAKANVEDALAHPNWDMGNKISVDSATLMNKGLEVIEARWLFDVPPERIDVVVHPQSIVHSLVAYRDTSVLAQLGLPDMRVPIAVALAHPERLSLSIPRLDLAEVSRLDFERPDAERFPCLALAYDALRGGEEAPAVLNAANEVAVGAFLARQVPFCAIGECNAAVLERHLGQRRGALLGGLDDVRSADAWARSAACEALGLMPTGQFEAAPAGAGGGPR